MNNQYLKQVLTNILAPNVSVITDNNQYFALNVRNGVAVTNFAAILKLSSLIRFTTLVELTAYDQPWSARRFTVVYFLLSVETNSRLALKCSVPESGIFQSLISVFSNASWPEREARDMFGIYFQNNKDLRRLLTDYGFEGFPLRKDFPLSGYIEVRYDDESQMILYEPVELSQEFRLFLSNSPWEKIN